jgi:hypothetical protein
MKELYHPRRVEKLLNDDPDFDVEYMYDLEE